MEEEGKAEASEDARKRASSMRVKTGDCRNPQSRRIAAVSAFKCNMAAFLGGGIRVGLFYVRRGKEYRGSVRAKTGKKVRANAVGGAQEYGL